MVKDPVFEDFDIDYEYYSKDILPVKQIEFSTITNEKRALRGRENDYSYS